MPTRHLPLAKTSLASSFGPQWVKSVLEDLWVMWSFAIQWFLVVSYMYLCSIRTWFLIPRWRFSKCPLLFLKVAQNPLGLVLHSFVQSLSLTKQTTFRDATNGFPANWRLRNKRRNSILMMHHCPDLGSTSNIGHAACEICFNQSEALPRSG